MSNANALELTMLGLINDERDAAGLEPLRLITLLNDAAEDHSLWMLEADEFSHTGEDGSSPADRMDDAGYPFEGNYLSAENIGWQSARGEEGFEDDVAQIHEGLMASDGHRANILDPNAQDIGIGIEIGTFTAASGDFEAVMATQVFATTEADVSAWVDPGTGVDDAEDPLEEEEEAPTEDDVVVGENEEIDDPAPEDESVDEEVVDDEVIAEADEEDGDVTADDEGEDLAEVETPMVPPMPCDLSQFTVDLSEAFEFRKEGDQLIWETSEEKILEAFQTAFDEWTTAVDAPSPDDIADLMLDEFVEAPNCGATMDTDVTDEWLMSDCA